MIVPFKYLIQPVALERDGDRIVREMPAQVVPVFSADQAVLMIHQFEAELAAMQNGNHREVSMPVEQENVVTISCDNPDCPGNTLDPSDRTGWTFVSSEVYGEPTKQNVYCCAECAGAITLVLNPPENIGEGQPG